VNVFAKQSLNYPARELNGVQIDHELVCRQIVLYFQGIFNLLLTACNAYWLVVMCCVTMCMELN